MLSILSAYIPEIPPLDIDGIFGNDTRNAVLAAQRRFGLPQTGVVDAATWDEIYEQFAGIENRSFLGISPANAAVATFSSGQQQPRNTQNTTMTQFPGRNLQMGHQDPPRQEVTV